MTSRKARRGFSRKELVIALGILFLLACVVVVGIARIREDSARTRCRNQMRQHGLGILNYESAYNRLPPLMNQGDGSLTDHDLPSIFHTLIPFLESTHCEFVPGRKSLAVGYHAHSSTSFSFRWKSGESATQNGGDANQVWSLFLCPADTTADHLRDVPVTLPDGSVGYYATGSYAANGLFPWNTKSKALGSADVILFAERPQVCRTGTGETVHNLWGVGFYDPQMPAFAALTPDQPGLRGSTGQVAPVLPLPDEASQLRVRVGRWDAEPQALDFVTPFQRIGPGRPCDPRLPGSQHAAGMQAVMADGSVRLFAHGIEPRVFWAACAEVREP